MAIAITGSTLASYVANGSFFGSLVTGSTGQFGRFAKTSDVLPDGSTAISTLTGAARDSVALKASISGSNLVAVLNEIANNAESIEAAGSNTEIQFNDGGDLGAEDVFTYTKGTNTMVVETITPTNINAFTLGGKLTAGAVEIEGSAFDINGGNIDGTAIGAASAAAGTFTTLVAGGNVDLGDAATDTVTVTGQFDSDLIPIVDSTSDLGTSAKQWAELHVDTGHIDALGSALNAASQAITNINVDSGVIDAVTLGSNSAITALTVEGATVAITDTGGDGSLDGVVVGGNSAAAGTFTTLVAGGNVDLGDATSDTITATGRFDSDLVPSTDSARGLGSDSLRWSNLYADAMIGDTGVFAKLYAGTGTQALKVSGVVGSGVPVGTTLSEAQVGSIPKLMLQGADAAGQLREFSLVISGGILQLQQAL